jgi:hypothetical protein
MRRNSTVQLLLASLTEDSYMTKPNQGIIRDNRGEEQPADKERAQTAHQSGSNETTPSKQGTRKSENDSPARSGHSQDK